MASEIFKSESHVNVSSDASKDVESTPYDALDPAGVDEKLGTAADRHNMLRMGKSQELTRNFRFVSMFGFTMILMGTWESVLSVSGIGLENGGTAGLIWMYFVCWIAFTCINTSMAEMGSMAPTVGGQYHWVSEFAPRQHQKYLSYLMGWLSVLGWQCGCLSGAYLVGTQIQGLIVLNDPNYVAERWHGTLLTIAVSVCAILFNILLARKLPLIEAIILFIHVFAFLGIMITLWVLAPVNTSAKQVFTQFNDGGGWNSLGGSALIGVTCGIYPLLGADAAVHMSEELRNASATLPRSMIWTTVVNGALGWVMAITLAFCVGNLEDVLDSPTGYPFMQIFFNAVESKAGATVMAVLVIAMFFFGMLTFVATSSRQLYAFARDKGVPFHSWFATVQSSSKVPVNALIFTVMFTSVLSVINIGSATALNSITGLQTNAMLSSYMCSIGCMIWRKAAKQPLLPSEFSLGRWGLPVNITSMVFLVVFFILAFFPTAPHPDASTMNWNILIYGAVILLSTVYYHVWGKKVYDGPVEYVRKLE